MNSVPYLRLAVPSGTLVLYDSMLEHRGSANTSPFVRPTLCFSLVQVHMSRFPVTGPTFSLRSQYKRFPLQMKNVIEGKRIPAPADDEYFQTVKERQDDILCLETIKQRCGKEFEAKDKSAKDLKTLYKCAAKLTDDTGSGCLLRSRNEKLLKMSIYNTSFVAKSSWGVYTRK
mmetsp:Transcript_5811/g.7337  ORF Transcript_5811/g.7337 Transcript_5811/m.7337 type:complete len:173 (-) Transcript_5811:599-1117(-)